MRFFTVPRAVSAGVGNHIGSRRKQSRGVHHAEVDARSQKKSDFAVGAESSVPTTRACHTGRRCVIGPGREGQMQPAWESNPLASKESAPAYPSVHGDPSCFTRYLSLPQFTSRRWNMVSALSRRKSRRTARAGCRCTAGRRTERRVAGTVRRQPADSAFERTTEEEPASQNDLFRMSFLRRYSAKHGPSPQYRFEHHEAGSRSFSQN